VLIDIRRITDASSLPLLVDADTGWGGAFNISRTVKSFVKAGAAGMHIEDQVGAKRCGHRPGKEIVPADEMADRVKAAVDARQDNAFFVIARTDAIASEGVERAIERSAACVEAGADAIVVDPTDDEPTVGSSAPVAGNVVVDVVRGDVRGVVGGIIVVISGRVVVVRRIEVGADVVAEFVVQFLLVRHCRLCVGVGSVWNSSARPWLPFIPLCVCNVVVVSLRTHHRDHIAFHFNPTSAPQRRKPNRET
jgi:hypothetical protein